MGWITEFHDHDISRDDMSIDHRVAAHLKREGSGIFGELEGVFIDRYATIGLLLLIRRVSGRNHAHQGYVDKVLLQGLQSLIRGVPTPEFGLIFNLSKRRHDPLNGTKTG